MQISWLGYNSFRIVSNGTTIVTDPQDPASGFSINRQGADIVVVSRPDGDVAKAISGHPFVVHDPGEYEVRSVFIQGVSCGDGVLYLCTIEDVSVAFIGATKVKELSDAQLAVVEGADILVVPVGGGVVCSAKEASTIINQVEPRIVIPAYYRIKGAAKLDGVETFLKEYSAPHEEMDKLKISKKDVLNEDTKIVVLKLA